MLKPQSEDNKYVSLQGLFFNFTISPPSLKNVFFLQLNVCASLCRLMSVQSNIMREELEHFYGDYIFSTKSEHPQFSSPEEKLALSGNCLS